MENIHDVRERKTEGLNQIEIETDIEEKIFQTATQIE